MGLTSLSPFFATEDPTNISSDKADVILPNAAKFPELMISVILSKSFLSEPIEDSTIPIKRDFY